MSDRPEHAGAAGHPPGRDEERPPGRDEGHPPGRDEGHPPGRDEGQRYGFADLVAVMDRLRAPGGCPWDRAQSPQSLRPYLIEEAYETLEAIDADDPQALREELGDVLLQVVFHAQMAREAGRFAVDDVVHALTEKLITRHPHVFGDRQLDTPAAVREHWESVKRATRGETFVGLPTALPALALAQKVQDRARALGFRWPDATAAVDKVRAELDELTQAEPETVPDELGDAFFTLVNVAIFYGVDAEQALRDGIGKFIARFERTQRLAEAAGRPLEERSLEEMLALWDQAKRAAG